MDIILKNYKNIENLSYTLEDNKINFLYGISGSGKSSISSAVSTDIDDSIVKVGKDIDDVNVEVSPLIPTSVYNNLYVEQLLLEESNEFVYNVLFANGSDLADKKEKMKEVFSKLEDHSTQLYSYIHNIDEVVKTYKIQKNKEDEKMFPKTSLITRLENEINNPKHSKYSNKIKRDGIDYYEWKKVGLSFPHFEDGICPFCLKKLSNYRKQLLGELLELTPKNFEAFVKKTDILKRVGIDEIDFKKRSINSVKKQLINKIKLASEVESILDNINSYNYNVINTKYNKIKMSKDFISEFPDLEDIINELNSNSIDINKAVSQLTKTTNKIIRKNEEKINKYLFSLGIPYIFKKAEFDTSSMTATYCLYHRDDALEENRVRSLSEGEKILLGLIFFVVGSTNNFLIIDDPASSYDETRKGIIFNIICENLKNKTVLVLSHDQMFSKYALFEKNYSRSKFKDYIGQINTIENYTGTAIIKSINMGDFNRLETHILNHINNEMPYFRKIINLKLLSEIYKNNRKKKNRVIYGYISDIIHNELNREEIINKINSEGFDEIELLKEMSDLFGLDNSFTIECIPTNVFDGFCADDLTMYERIVYEREKMDNNDKNDIIRCEYNNIVHLNNNYLSILNPYEFNYFSPAIYEMIFK